jgi:hypothetical protein
MHVEAREQRVRHPFLFPRSEALCCPKMETLRLDDLEDDEIMEVVAQTTTLLPFLDDQVPVLYLSDGRPYIPVFAVCRALGIRPDIHIRRWRRLVLWSTARMLPFQTEKRGKRLVWCLLISEVPFLYSLFDWNQVTPERRLQLHRATEAQIRLADLAYQQMQREYKAMRQALFTFMSTFDNIDSLLMRYAEAFGPRLDSGSAAVLTELCERGRFLFAQATAHARRMLQEQGELPVVDLFKIDADNQVIDSFSMPLLPIVPKKDRERFFAFLGLLTAWRQEITAFWNEQGP